MLEMRMAASQKTRGRATRRGGNRRGWKSQAEPRLVSVRPQGNKMGRGAFELSRISSAMRRSERRHHLSISPRAIHISELLKSGVAVVASSSRRLRALDK